MTFIVVRAFTIASLIGVLLCGSACSKNGREVLTSHTIDLLFRFHTAEKKVIGLRDSELVHEYVAIRDVPVSGQIRRSVYLHPTSEIRFPVELGDSPVLRFAAGLSELAWTLSGDGAVFIVTVTGERGIREVYRRHLDPIHRQEDRSWHEVEIDLREFAGQAVKIVFRTEVGPDGNGVGDWAAFAHPRLEQEPIRRVLPEDGLRNILLITTDTLRADRLATYGCPDIYTPATSRLSRSGALFSSATSQFNNTVPSHASIMTSNYGRTHGAYSTLTPMRSDMATMAMTLLQDGFSTGAVVSSEVLDPRTSGMDQGFQIYLHPRRERRADRSLELALSWLQEHYHERFFLWVHFFDTHMVYNPPPPYARMYRERENQSDQPKETLTERYRRLGMDRDPETLRVWLGGQTDPELPEHLYRGEVSYLDKGIGVLLRRLEELDILDLTAVALIADHGESLGEHGVLFDHLTSHQEVLHVPLMISAEGVTPGTLIARRVESIDLAPTLLGLLDVETPEQYLGRDLLNSEGSAVSAPVFFEHSSGVTKGVVQGPWKLLTSAGPRGVEGMREDTLYHLHADPNETVNLAKEAPEVFETLMHEIENWKRRIPWKKPSADVSIDPEHLERLQALGYLK